MNKEQEMHLNAMKARLRDGSKREGWIYNASLRRHARKYCLKQGIEPPPWCRAINRTQSPAPFESAILERVENLEKAIGGLNKGFDRIYDEQVELKRDVEELTNDATPIIRDYARNHLPSHHRLNGGTTT